TTSAQGSEYHAGILFLNGAGFRVRVKKTPSAFYSPKQQDASARHHYIIAVRRGADRQYCHGV
ncbi:hypothetical protein, partial [Pseudomonas cerasi]